MGVWGVPLGISHSMGYNVALFTLAAATLEGTRQTLPVHRLYGATASGVVVHTVKYGYVLLAAWLSGMLRDIEIYGFLAGLRNHIVFGLAGGIVAWASLRAGRSLARRLHARRRGA